MRLRTTATALALLLMAGAAPAASGSGSTLISNVSIVDGTGAQARAGSVRIVGGKIACAGVCRAAPGDATIDGKDQVLAPGFIDTHSHHDRKLDELRLAPAVVRQGVTTIVVGQDGFSDLPVSGLLDRLDREPAAINVATFVGHGSIREAVMGKDPKKAATPAQIARMKALVDAAMRQGALGLSTGLEYEPAMYSRPEEVLELARTAARHGGRYISHMRSEDVRFDDALGELLEIGRVTGMPVQVTHMKLAMVDRWGQAGTVLQRLDAARRQGIKVSADVYPYAWWQSSLDVLLPSRDFTNRKEAEFALGHLAPPEGMILSEFTPDPALVGQSIAQIATQRGTDPAETYLALNREASAPGHSASVMANSMTDADIAAFIGWEHSSICSDGMLVDRHPRGAGSFPKVFAWLVRGEGKLTLEQAVHKMTGLAARQMGFADRGHIAVGQAADLVLFDPALIADKATFADPSAAPVGIERVWVNGVEVLRNGEPSGAMPGKVLRRQSSKAWR
jgi:N-acyl-D-amino-acid deacylase